VKKITLNLPSESARLAPVDVKLEKATPHRASSGGPGGAREGRRGVQEGRFADARAEYEKLLTLRPELADTLYRHIAFTYSREGNYAKEVEYLERCSGRPRRCGPEAARRPGGTAGRHARQGPGDAEGVDDSSIKDPEVFYNVAALLLNAQKPEEAIRYLNKAVTVDPAYVDGYFQRGLAYLGLQKTAEAKADSEGIELAPPARRPRREESPASSSSSRVVAQEAFTSAWGGTWSPNRAVKVPGPCNSPAMRRTSPSVARMTPEPRLRRRTPSASSSGTGGQPRRRAR